MVARLEKGTPVPALGPVGGPADKGIEAAKSWDCACACTSSAFGALGASLVGSGIAARAGGSSFIRRQSPWEL
jgi:hypothetical protein